jgi:hypothetical protein
MLGQLSYGVEGKRWGNLRLPETVVLSGKSQQAVAILFLCAPVDESGLFAPNSRSNTQ